MSPTEAKLKDGAEWVDHEDCIIGNELGLKNLMDACKVALEKGEYFGNNLGDYVGVKKLGDDWFKEPMDSKPTKLANWALGLAFCIAIILMLLGA